MTSIYDDTSSVTVHRGDLAKLFDLAVGSLDFGSDFWNTDSTEVARKIAGILGVCPMIATPSSHRKNYPLCEGITEEMILNRLDQWRAAGWDMNVYNRGHCITVLDHQDH